MPAFLIPENIASRGDIPSSIQQVARAFRDDLDESATVWLEGLGSSEDLLHLVVLDPNAGLLLVDAPSLEGRIGQGGVKPSQRLSQEDAESVLSRLREQRDGLAVRFNAHRELLSDFPVRCTVALPLVDPSAAERLGFSSQEMPGLLLKPDFAPGRLPVALRRVLGTRMKPLSEVEDRVVRGLIHPRLVIDRLDEPDHDGQLLIFRPPNRTGEDAIRVLDREQERVARFLGDGYRVIRGVAGSGKTLILTYRAQLLAENFPQWRILMTCFNVCLAKSLEQHMARFKNVTVKHIDSYAWSVLPPSERPAATSASAVNWTELRQRAAMKIGQRPDLRTFDVVLVDEGQDFDAPAFDLAYASLRAGREGFIVALDHAQNIYRKRARWNPPGQTAQGRTKTLRVNYRNTKEILEFAFKFLGQGIAVGSDDEALEDDSLVVRPEAASRRGLRPKVYQCSSVEEELKKIVELVETRHGQGVPYGDMLVLLGSQDAYQLNLYWKCRERDIPYFWVSRNSDAKRKIVENRYKLRASTIQAVKGLEFPCVFVCGVNSLYDPEEAQDNLFRLLYSGMTRATEELHITISGQGEIGQAVLKAAN